MVYRNFFLLILVITFVITTLLSFIAGAIPLIGGPLGQQINALLGGIWLVYKLASSERQFSSSSCGELTLLMEDNLSKRLAEIKPKKAANR
ncbi:hypothetical protein ICE98_00494 [Lactococcus lactis]|nr:hypothetical protein [Lactococcus lactis]